MSKHKNQQDNIPNLKTMSVVLFFMGLITVYTIMPDNMMALVGYSIIVGGALAYYVLLNTKKQEQEQGQDAVCSRLEALKVKMEADEAKLAEREKKLAQIEAEQSRVEEEFGDPSLVSVARWQEICGEIEEAAYAAKQGKQYKSLLSMFGGKKDDAHLSADEASKAKSLYLAIAASGLSAMKKQLQGEKKARADIKANLEKDIRQKKKKRRK